MSEALSRPMMYHRGAEFKRILQGTTELLRPLFGSSLGTPILMSSSGTGGLEAALTNIVGPGDIVVCLDNGHWSARFGNIAKRLGATVEVLRSDWGQGANVDALRHRLSKAGGEPIAAVLAVHNDTFSGAVSDLPEIGRIVQNSSALLVVDAVSSLGSMPVEADAWGLDIVVSASQKGLMCPPGLAILSASEKAWDRVSRREVKTTYFDLVRARELASGGQTPFTPAVNLVLGLHEALSMIHEVGISETYARHERLSRALTAGATALGFSVFPDANAASTSVCVLRAPVGVEADKIIETMHDRFGTIIAGARNSPIAGEVVRVSTMGYCTSDDVRLDIRQLASILKDSFPTLDIAAAVGAVEQELAAA